MSMGGFAQDLADMRAGVLDRVNRVRTVFRRATPGPALVRGAVFVCALLTQFVAWPTAITLSRVAIALAVIALLPALLPRGFAPMATILVAVGGWLVATVSYGEQLTYLRLILLAGLLYLLHTLAALAAVLPYDAIVSAGVLGRWLLRAGFVVVLTGAVGLFAVAVPQWLGGSRYLIASLAGLGVLVALTGYLASLFHRR